MSGFFENHYDQVIASYLPIFILLLDILFKVMFGSRHLHPFGGDMALCGFTLYFGAVLSRLQFGPGQSNEAIISEMFGIAGALVAWFFTVFLGSLERVWVSWAAGILGVISSSLCAQGAWHILAKK